MQQNAKKEESAFQNLRVWQNGMGLTRRVYAITRKLPKEEMFGLTSQMRRCAVSIPSNIAEGSKRGTKKDFLQFLRIASGSAAELETQLLLIHDEYSLEVVQELQELKILQKMLESLMRKL